MAIVSLSGRFAAGADGPFLRQKAEELFGAGSRKMIIDFSGVPYIDSTGLGFLAASRSLAEKAKAEMILCGVTATVRQILDRMQLAQFFSIEPDEKAALARFAAPPKLDRGEVAPSGPAKAESKAGRSADN